MTNLAEQIAPKVAELHALGMGRNEIADQLEVSGRTVTRAAEIAGVQFDASALEKAAAVLEASNKQRRELLATAALEVAADRLRRIPNADARDGRDLAVAFGVLVDKSGHLEDFEATKSHTLTMPDALLWVRAMRNGGQVPNPEKVIPDED